MTEDGGTDGRGSCFHSLILAGAAVPSLLGVVFMCGKSHACFQEEINQKKAMIVDWGCNSDKCNKTTRCVRSVDIEALFLAVLWLSHWARGCEHGTEWWRVRSEWLSVL